MSDAALVSVCMPAYNAEPWIRAAVESVLGQTYENWELVVSDGGSSDATIEILSSFDDSRIRVDKAPRRLQAITNWNRSVLLSQGEYVKFLHQDDTLCPTCIEEMVALAQVDSGIGLVFARREVRLQKSPGPAERAWAEAYADLHTRFTSLESVNDGRELFRQMLDADLEQNWVAEPSSVLVTRACLTRIGLFNPRLRQVMDLELWLRVMLRYRIGFINRVLSTYLHHRSSMTGENERLARGWLDRLWLLEALLGEDLLEPDRQRIRRLRNSAQRAALRAQVGRIARRRFSSELVDYGAYRVRSTLGGRPALHPRLRARAPVPTEHVPG